jgi:hypothetical protein
VVRDDRTARRLAGSGFVPMAVVASNSTQRQGSRLARGLGRVCCVYGLLAHCAFVGGAALAADLRPQPGASAEGDARGGWPPLRLADLAAEADTLPPPALPPSLRELDALPLRRPPGEPRPPTTPQAALDAVPQWDDDLLLVTPRQAPLGFSGRSSVVPLEYQQDSHFVPMPDRWRSGFPFWNRYGPDHSVFEPRDPFEEDAPYVRGWWLNPYRQNVLKGDYPIVGQHTFLNVTVASVSDVEFRQVPTPTTPFESTEDPFSEEFFGNPDQFFFRHDLRLSLDLFHGDAGFKPFDWRLKVTPIFNINYLDVEELGVVSPDVQAGTTRYRTFTTLEEWFIEKKLVDTSPYYDFASLRVGSQPFVSDFRGFIFADVNRAVRVFGTRNANRDQFNVILLDQREKDTNSELNAFRNRTQNVAIANYYRQDFIWPGYTTQLSAHYNQDRGHGLVFDRNGFLARPDPVGVFTPHSIDAVYLGWAGDGHINRYNISHAFYWAVGRDDLNPLAGQAVTINAQMAAAEISYDRDWMRFRTSFFWASGDDDISDDRGRGFDAIFDNPNFAGGEFSYWQRQAIRLLGVNLVDRFSLVPHLRSSKIQGQTNFVNPGLLLINVGTDVEVTPRARLIGNANLIWFDDTSVIEQFVFQSGIDQHVGTDLSLGFEYRPLLNDNLILVGGVSTLLPGAGFRDIYNPLVGETNELFASFLQIAATF